MVIELVISKVVELSVCEIEKGQRTRGDVELNFLTDAVKFFQVLTNTHGVEEFGGGKQLPALHTCGNRNQMHKI